MKFPALLSTSKFSLSPLLVGLSLVFSGTQSIAGTTPSFAESQEVIAFAQDLAKRQGFNADTLLTQFATTHPNAQVLKLIQPPVSPQQRSWERYRQRFLTNRRIDAGVKFWQQHQVTLAKASSTYGVPEEIIVGIIGVETEYGQNMGNFRVLEALATLAFAYPPRADFFRTELEQFLLMSRENDLDPSTIRGSFAGAIGVPQFMPGSQRRYGVDFDGDHRIDLSNSVEDAIGSVAHFLEQHGWQAGAQVAVPALVNDSPAPELLEAGIRPKLNTSDLAGQGIRSNIADNKTVALIDLVTPGKATEYWLGLDNFYVITRYNRSSFYAMAVFQLAEAVRNRRCGNETLTTTNREKYCRA